MTHRAPVVPILRALWRPSFPCVLGGTTERAVLLEYKGYVAVVWPRLSFYLWTLRGPGLPCALSATASTMTAAQQAVEGVITKLWGRVR